MKQKDISQQLGNLINQTAGVYTPVPVDDVIPSELEQPEPLFELDHEAERKQKVKEALVTVNYIMKSVIPKKYHNDEMLQNKMMLDAEQLGMLYYNQTSTYKTLQSAIDQIAKGDTQPRMYEVADKFEKRATDISNQITDLQNQLRKYYIDAYLDIQSRELADDHDEDNESRKQHAAIPNNNAEPAQKQLEQKDDGSVLITSPMDMRERLDAVRIQKAKARAQAAKEIDYEEVKE